MFDDRPDVKFVLHKEAAVNGKMPANAVLCNATLATLIGKSAFAGNGTERLEPSYLRNN